MGRGPTGRLGVSFITAIDALQQLVGAVPGLVEHVTVSQWQPLIDLFVLRRSHHIFGSKFLCIIRKVSCFCSDLGAAVFESVYALAIGLLSTVRLYRDSRFRA